MQAKLRNTSLSNITPCRASFRQHVLRASLQTRVWLSSYVADPDIPSPIGHGWNKDPSGVGITPHYFDGPTTAELMEDLLCSCRVGVTTCNDYCACMINHLPCTELCPCHTEDSCDNIYNSVNESDDEDEV